MATIFGAGDYCCYCFGHITTDNSALLLGKDDVLEFWDVCVPCAQQDKEEGWFWYE